MTVRPARRDDADALGGVLARAFTDDPIWSWVYPQADRTRRLHRMFRALLRTNLDRGATVLTDDGRRAAAIWQRSDARGLGLVGNLRMGAAMLSSGARMRRGMQLIRTIERLHPQRPHWYLAVLGTDPSAQGHGLGSSLVREVLDHPAHRDDAAYLETETEANVPFYRRFGFAVVDEVDVGTDGPHLWLMWRDPPAPSGP